MHNSRRRWAATGPVVAATVLGTLFAAAPADAHPAHGRAATHRPHHAAHTAAARITTRLGGLDSPRGLTFDGRGNLYVAESGVAGSGAMGITRSGKVSKYRPGSTTAAWSTGFASIYATEDPSGPPDVLGPEGLSTLAGSCTQPRHGRHGRGAGCTIDLIVSESGIGVADETGSVIQDKDAGQLYALDGRTGAATDVAEVGNQSYLWTQAHPDLASDFPDADPYDVLVLRDRHTHRVRTFVVDAAANTVDEVMRDGTLRVIAYIPNETAAPNHDSTPTCVTQGPDGALYVGTLDLITNLSGPGGASNVYRVDPDADYPTAPQLWATGLTTVTGCTFDRTGTFWATEMFATTSGAPGDLVAIPFRHPDALRRVGAGSLPMPGDVTQGPDGALYVTVNAAGAPGSGAVVRVATGRCGRR